MRTAAVVRRTRVGTLFVFSSFGEHPAAQLGRGIRSSLVATDRDGHAARPQTETRSDAPTSAAPALARRGASQHVLSLVRAVGVRLGAKHVEMTNTTICSSTFSSTPTHPAGGRHPGHWRAHAHGWQARAMPPSHDELLDRVARLNVWKRGGQRAPHKPLLMLLALARLQQGATRLTPFAELADPLRGLLEEFGPTRKSYHPEYPFWRLQNDGLWQVTSASPMRRRHGSTDVPVNVLRDAEALGGFPEDVDDALRTDPRLVTSVAKALLDAHFPESLHEEILAETGLSLSQSSRRRPARDPAFRLEVLNAYEHRCAVCGFDARLDGRSIGIEAAHVKWHAAGGPDQVDNSLALCALHHKALDFGLYGVDDHHHIVVSRRLSGGEHVWLSLVRHHGAPLRPPQSGLPTVATPYLAWHREEVFKGPARADGPNGP